VHVLQTRATILLVVVVTLPSTFVTNSQVRLSMRLYVDALIPTVNWPLML
jgi:hypothetical protein